MSETASQGSRSGSGRGGGRSRNNRKRSAGGKAQGGSSESGQKASQNQNKSDDHSSKDQRKKQQQNDKSNAKGKDESNQKDVIYAPVSKPLTWPADSKVLVISYDLENAYGSELSEIYQIGLLSSLDDSVENNRLLVNILPQGVIHWGVTKYAGTHIKTEFDRTTNEKFLWHVKKKEKLSTIEPREGFKRIVDWIAAQKEASGCEKVVMMAHGNMDAPCFLNNLHYYGLLDQLQVDGFGDSVPYIRNRLAAAFERLYPGQRFEAHNALADADALLKILCKKQSPGTATT